MSENSNHWWGPPRITQVMRFPNGMVATFDQYGHQMPAYQGPEAEVKGKVEADAPPGAVFFGCSWVPKSKAESE